jgi:glutathione S-transferase
MERYRLMEWLNFITSELHKGLSPLFNPAMPEQAKALSRTRLADRLAWVDTQLEGRDYLMGAQFSVADAYLFTVAGWGKYVGVDIAPMKNLSAYMGRVAARPAVQAALKAEGLLK